MIILVSQRVDVAATGERRDALDQNWSSLVTALGAALVPVPNHPRTAQALLSALPVAGIILSGGNDLGTAPERDATEAILADWAMARSVPLLGVCRGMQFLVTHLGGGIVPAPGHVAVRHDVSGAWGRQQVNSYHNFGVDALPPGLEAVAHADDGTIEAFRHAGAPVAGVMWHPERELSTSEASLTLFRAFFRHQGFSLPCAF